ncbi:hypothetical protein [Pseudomonas sp. TE50-2]|uniref:hypothetical protein n=1 Tax=Pseudomonas sp. TE50-2 TaxID=3142707 RepID=UPI0034659245
MEHDRRWKATGSSTVPLAVAWLMALTLNLMLWGQELWLDRVPGIVCLAQLGTLLPLLFLTFKALLRQMPVTGYRALLVGALGAVVTTLDLMIYVHPGGGSAQLFQSMHWVRSAESIGPLPTALLVLLIYLCLLYCQLLAYWNMQCADQTTHRT